MNDSITFLLQSHSYAFLNEQQDFAAYHVKTPREFNDLKILSLYANALFAKYLITQKIQEMNNTEWNNVKVTIYQCSCWSINKIVKKNAFHISMKKQPVCRIKNIYRWQRPWWMGLRKEDNLNFCYFSHSHCRFHFHIVIDGEFMLHGCVIHLAIVSERHVQSQSEKT